jgi:hypothetical protein
LGQDNPAPNLNVLPAILAGLDYQSIFQRLREKRAGEEPLVERVWSKAKSEAPSRLRPFLESLDCLEERFLARKKLYYMEVDRECDPVLHWQLSEAVMKRLGEPVSDDADVEAARKLIAARYLVAESPHRPWQFAWDE